LELGDNRGGNRRHVDVRELLDALMYILGADSDGSRPGFRDDLARHSDLMSLGIPR
jgi:hypothetical protein